MTCHGSCPMDGGRTCHGSCPMDGCESVEEAAATLAPLLGLAHRIVQLEVLTLAHTLLDPLDRLQAARGV